ncbi:hypothetical protein DWB67_16920 [Paracoccus sp. JM45]|nr:hypothetical protein DWB67_16920 [Paracoccus sp. JM45]
MVAPSVRAAMRRQGSQFTSTDFTEVLLNASVKISMDGPGRWVDNRIIERLWRSLKYECVYLNAFEVGSEARKGTGAWITSAIKTKNITSARRERFIEALLQNGALRRDAPFPPQCHATRTIVAVPRAGKRFMRAMRIWIFVVWRSGFLAAIRSPNAFKHRIFASMRLRA